MRSDKRRYRINVTRLEIFVISIISEEVNFFGAWAARAFLQAPKRWYWADIRSRRFRSNGGSSTKSFYYGYAFLAEFIVSVAWWLISAYFYSNLSSHSDYLTFQEFELSLDFWYFQLSIVTTIYYHSQLNQNQNFLIQEFFSISIKPSNYWQML